MYTRKIVLTKTVSCPTALTATVECKALGADQYKRINDLRPRNNSI